MTVYILFGSEARSDSGNVLGVFSSYQDAINAAEKYYFDDWFCIDKFYVIEHGEKDLAKGCG